MAEVIIEARPNGDGNDNVVDSKPIPFTDFPLSSRNYQQPKRHVR